MTQDTPEDTTPTARPHAPGAEPSRPERHMLEALVCPLTHGPLDYDAERQELVSRWGKVAFPIRSGIPIMLVDEARKLEP